MATNEELMSAMIAEQANRKKASLEKMKKVEKPDEVDNSGIGVTRVHYEVDPRDLKPNPFRTVTEDVVANSDDEEGKFEKRKDEGVGRT
ncbi:MAG: hypothetical protein UX08_C0011G0017 [Candidatus Collierbacteria bacterium GW2011_GWB1_45_35]|uniref:Uncharacterized protein n=1 Tax=Candidatus Collierbacteria bacterium GW2011_GWB2_45_17 TaxID=1618388 RepID=A0A837IHX4_9BACT|nr:MAG: hypothetical protein UW48_C0010G0030 [Microgenomates group bacterium GW2011_GWC1_44_23]KKT94848.1 MAG: hypothetical protein UW96_C0014G0017 [Candidatus Collierbacteria bacterium GW2011_GWA1_45_15]KKT99676.1 MAG: hypothetical protein UX01_C0008G0044 [Candidatus Collierbacteria bacterium GW2011_GWB2_45_17]KKU05091.1 MAG: hypothetical protein UX08_C0011G0017 [Candidatus Collierbacteria bacterium GW2011_GWB1_45_35]KKU07185.1 MAG: hypothetical protein UX11_C0019G0025 [Candidatus Collierbacte